MEVSLPIPYSGRVNRLTFFSRSAEWEHIQGGEGGFRAHGKINVPDWLVDEQHRVEDCAAYRFVGQGIDPSVGEAIEAGCIAFILESPHRCEFDTQTGTALAPLQNIGTRAWFEACLPDLLAQVAGSIPLPKAGDQIVLVNAIQYQASLDALMTRRRQRLLSCVRDQVWKRLFSAGGSECLVRRLETYSPKLILIGSTKETKGHVVSAIVGAGYHRKAVVVSNHPADWFRRNPRLI